jgi:DNA-binding MarR family transcriptional regulator
MDATDYYKIGYTLDEDTLKKRISAIKTGNPLPLVLIGTFDGDYEDETKIHSQLNQFKTSAQNEWFTLDKTKLSRIIKDLKLKKHTIKNSNLKGIDKFLNNLFSSNGLKHFLSENEEADNSSISTCFTIFICLASKADKEGNITIGVREISKLCSKTNSTTRRSLKILEKNGFISISRNNTYSRTTYKINLGEKNDTNSTDI